MSMSLGRILGAGSLQGAAAGYIQTFLAAAGAGAASGAWSYFSVDAALSMQVVIQVVIISVVAAVVQYLFSSVIAQIGSAIGITNADILDSAGVGIACGLVAFYMANLGLWGVAVAAAGGAAGAFLGLMITSSMS
jgi:hypothetical protein